MKVPLDARLHFEGRNMLLDILTEKGWKKVKPPFHPYVYSRTKDLPVDHIIEELDEYRFLGTDDYETLYKLKYMTTGDIARLNREDFDSKELIFESHIKYLHRVAIDEPEFFLDYPFNGSPSYLVVDIELVEDKILIGCGDGNNVNQYVVKEDGEHKKENENELWLFSLLVNASDIIVGYNIEGFDWPRIEKLCREYKVPLPDNYLMFDVADFAMKDQTLTGIKSYHLKDVANWFGIESEELEWEEVEKYTWEDICEYNKSDLHATKELFKIYYNQVLPRAEYVGIPLGMLVGAYSSTEHQLLCGRACHENGVVSGGKNSERHPGFKKIEGAYVEILSTGLHRNVVKADFKQMYPSIAIEMLLSPENTRIVRMKDYKMDYFNVIHRKKYMYVEVSDSNIGRNVLVKIDKVKEPYMVQILKELGEMRERYKQEMKECSNISERTKLHSKQWAAKILRNKYYGNSSSKHFRFADIAIGIVITGFAREIMKLLTKRLEKAGYKCIEIDTDGIYLTTDKNSKETEEEINALTNECLDAVFGRPTEAMVMDYDYYDWGFFIKMKNYILMDHEGNLTVKGSGLHGRKKPKLFDKVLIDIANKIGAGESEDIFVDDYTNWNKYNIGDFTMTQGLRKKPDEYSPTSMQAKLLTQANHRGLSIEQGDLLTYWKATYGHVLTPVKREDLDKNYYRDMICRLFNSLELDSDADRFQTGISEFSGGTESGNDNISISDSSSLNRLFDTKIIECPKCHGTGLNGLDECDKCGGNGKITRSN